MKITQAHQVVETGDNQDDAKQCKLEALRTRWKEVSYVAGLALVTLIFELVFNIYIFHETQGFCLSLSYLLASFCILYFIFLLACRVRTIGFIVLPYVFLCSIAPWYIHKRFGIFLSQDVVSSILETNWEEAAPYINAESVSLSLLGVVFIAAMVLTGHRFIAPKTSNVLMLSCAVLFGVFFLVTRPFSQNYVQREGANPDVHEFLSGRYWPVADCYRVVSMVKLHFEFSSKLYSDIKRLPSGYVPRSADSQEPEDVVVVLMMGESVRADHLGINGYDRDTTPNLQKRKEQMVSFKNTCSFGLFTRVSIIGILTDAEVSGRTVMHKPFPEILEKDGFLTSVLLPDVKDIRESLTRKMTEDIPYKYPISTECSEGDAHQFMPTVEQFRKALSDGSAVRKNFILLYDNGAHIFFKSLEKNKKFLPDKPATDDWKDNLKEWTNAYDNNIVEIDMEMEDLLSSLEKCGKPAVFIYASDHGVALGEGGCFGHGNSSKPVYNPAMFVWCSPSYIEKYPEMFKALQANAGKAVSHDHVMHTVLSASGVRRGVYKPELDLFNPDAKETPAPADINRMYEIRCGDQDGVILTPH